MPPPTSTRHCFLGTQCYLMHAVYRGTRKNVEKGYFIFLEGHFILPTTFYMSFGGIVCLHMYYKKMQKRGIFFFLEGHFILPTNFYMSLGFAQYTYIVQTNFDETHRDRRNGYLTHFMPSRRKYLEHGHPPKNPKRAFFAVCAQYG